MPTYNTFVPGPVSAKKLPHTTVWGEVKFAKGIGLGTFKSEGLLIDRNIASSYMPAYFSFVISGRKWLFHDSGPVAATEPASSIGQIWPRRRDLS